jgi:NADPH:quinone reductase-like Zn-dependent oxidoreductase
MKAAYASDSKVPVYGEFEEPVARDGGIVVTMSAAALTNLDIGVAEGRHYFSPKTHPFVIGMEGVGRLESGERRYFPGTSMLFPFGSAAERALVKPERALAVPEGIPDEMAAALGNAGLAGWLTLSWSAQVQPGEKVLILGATGASGLIAVAAASLLGAGRVVAAGRDPSALERAKSLGADAIVSLAGDGDMTAAFREAAGGDIDVVIDLLNGPPAEAALQAMAMGGRMVQLGSALGTGIRVPAQLARKNRLSVLGFAYYHAPIDVQAAAYWGLCENAIKGKVFIDHEAMPLSAIEEAWKRQKAGGNRQRLVLVP